MNVKVFLVLSLFSCRTDTGKIGVDTASVQQNAVDLDGDGFDNTEDCDDGNSNVNPMAVELCDGMDNNCNGDVDEGVLNTFYADTDGDGFGNIEDFTLACFAEEDFVNNGNDCDDNDSSVYPSAPEQCDEIDNDCDGIIDEDLQTEWWLDEDRDGFGDPTYFAEGCLAEEGFAANPDDCNDIDPDIHPDMEEVCDEVDNNCDGQIDEDLTITVYLDADLDGFGDESQWVDVCELTAGYALIGGDCDDINTNVHPNAIEVCDEVDNNCDGQINENVGSPSTIWYDDVDGDGFGDDSTGEIGCTGDLGDVMQGGDCDDLDPNNYPTNTEICDGQDNNCDNTVDDADPFILGQPTFYQDLDGDGVGSGVTQLACSQPVGFVAVTGDCVDLDNTVYPGAPEICDNIDNTCDGLVDDNDPAVIGQTTFFLDGDGDGVGSSTTQLACFVPSGYVTTSGDCDDANTAVYSGAQEVCDGLDNDCNGAADDDDSGIVGQSTYYLDNDGDGFGTGLAQLSCNQPSGFVSNTGDCNDNNGLINPNASEVCDTIDNDCDGAIDDADGSVVGQTTYFEDSDGDGYGSGVSQTACNQPSGYVTSPGDCDDDASLISPVATEVCDFVDNDCDGAIDDADGSITGQSTFYLDEDGDGYGTSSSFVESCFPVGGYVSNNSDCDDGDSSEYPGVTWYSDNDGDGYGNSNNSFSCSRNNTSDVNISGDCNDGDNAINPAATEACDSVDNDCDGAIDDADSGVIGQSTFYQDFDGDGFGSNVTTQACAQPSGYVTNIDDCDDTSALIKPGATEVCDGVDNDCDGAMDDADSNVTGQNTYYIDSDGDGYGVASVTIQSCSTVGGYASNASDCDDGDSSEYPGVTWYSDNDGDGYGNTSSSFSCSRNSGSDVQNSGDCNDGNSSVSPGAGEQCDLADNNCNGAVDEGVSCTRPIYRGLNASNGWHMYSTSTVSGGGYSSEGYAFSLYTSPAPGTTALYRCRNYGTGKTFLTTSSSCEGSGMSVDMTLGYIAVSGVSGTTQLYRLYANTPDDHLYTTSTSERSFAMSIGYISEGVSGSVW